MSGLGQKVLATFGPCPRYYYFNFRKEDMMLLCADLIDEVLSAPENEQVIKRVREKVNETMKDYPLFAY